MKLSNPLTYAVAMLLFASSCKSLQKSSSYNTSKVSSSPKFIDGVTLKPGEEKGKRYVTKDPPKDIKPFKTSTTRFNIEKANWLQIKYAILLDLPVERVTDTRLIEVMDHWWGTHYCMGGTTEQCIDCSGFTQVFMRDVFKVDIPRVANDQYKSSERIDEENLKEGDLVFFRTQGRGISHVGIYLCNGRFVHASTSSGVMISSLDEDYWSKKYVAAGRVISNAIGSAIHTTFNGDNASR